MAKRMISLAGVFITTVTLIAALLSPSIVAASGNISDTTEISTTVSNDNWSAWTPDQITNFLGYKESNVRTYQLHESAVERQIEPYVRYDVENSQYYLAPEAQAELPTDVFQIGQRLISFSNSSLKEVASTRTDYLVTDPQTDKVYNQDGTLLSSFAPETRVAFKEGVTSASFNWNHVRIKIKKSHMNNAINAGAVASIQIAKLVQALKIATGRSSWPGGIWFDLNYFVLGASAGIGAAAFGQVVAGIGVGALATAVLGWDWQ